MKVLLLGDYSGFHYNLAKGLKKLGVNVTVASEGDGWKNITRDIDIKRPDNQNRITFLYKLYQNYHKLIGFDIVQLISPNFLMSSPYLSSAYFDFLKRKNGVFFTCATGMDYTYVKYALSGQLDYSVFYNTYIKDDPYINRMKLLASNKPLAKLEKKISTYCNGIIATSNGYYDAYKNSYPNKTTYIPLPIDTSEYSFVNTLKPETEKIKFFVGLMNDRIVIKGLDRILKVLRKLEINYPNEVEIEVVNSVPLKEYTKLLNSSHILCDQIYANGLGMNAIIAMAKGLIIGSCGGERFYATLGEYDNKPIIDFNTSDEMIYFTLEKIITNRRSLYDRAIKSREFVVKHFDCVKVAKQYIEYWKKFI
ncbi:glycosyltransferase [Plebeiibacterium sediminum]|uniref:Glycosyltransferase n=1 Tax=Plebeiibacterium sediminum TaxID=2992112 RepID=A0AAE3SDR1_9BACT|nr:glycosyltransferase [Plebeiobacterium sediminum]MCW3785520.1 glycosyltransferase [Plebeiobacterium sediminum]